MFDSREYLEALEPPVFIAQNGVRFVGRVISVDEWEPFKERMLAVGEATDFTAVFRLHRDLTQLFFPRGRRFWTRRFWRPAWWYVSRLPPLGQMKAVYSFMQSQVRALGQELPPPTPGLKKLLGLSIAPNVDRHLGGR